MQLEVRKTKKLLPVFSDIHGEQNGNKLAIEVTFAIDPNIEALAAAFYMDGSGSMQEAGNYGRQGLFGLGRQRNLVEEAMRVIIPYISHKDTNGKCYVAYWSTGEQGKNIEPIGELSSEAAGITSFVGPTAYGNETRLLPAVRDFVAYIQRLLKQGETVQAALAVIVTDGKFHDFTDVRDYTKSQLVPAIVAGKFPKTVFSVVGVGKDVDPEQMEELMHEATPKSYSGRPIWCYALADSVGQLPELVSHLVDANTPAFYGGATFSDAKGNILARFEDMVPTVVEFELPLTERKFIVSAGDKSYTQEIDVVEADHEGDDDE